MWYNWRFRVGPPAGRCYVNIFLQYCMYFLFPGEWYKDRLTHVFHFYIWRSRSLDFIIVIPTFSSFVTQPLYALVQSQSQFFYVLRASTLTIYSYCRNATFCLQCFCLQCFKSSSKTPRLTSICFIYTEYTDTLYFISIFRYTEYAETPISLHSNAPFL